MESASLESEFSAMFAIDGAAVESDVAYHLIYMPREISF